MATLIPLADVAPDLIEQLLDRAFEPDRRRRTAYRLREGARTLERLSFAALDTDDLLVGTIQCWPIALTDDDQRAHPMIMVGPVAVLPDQQGLGYGRALMHASIAAIDPGAPLPQVLIGDAAYYGQWGFGSEHTRGWKLPGPYDPDRLLTRCTNAAILPRAGLLGPWRR